jgi:hypothetical protein
LCSSIHPLVDLGWYHILAIVNNATKKHKSIYLFEIQISILLIYIQLWDCWMVWYFFFKFFLRSYHMAFHNSHTNLYSHQQCIRVTIYNIIRNSIFSLSCDNCNSQQVQSNISLCF